MYKIDSNSLVVSKLQNLLCGCLSTHEFVLYIHTETQIVRHILGHLLSAVILMPTCIA